MDHQSKTWCKFVFGLTVISFSTWRNKRLINLVLAGDDLQGDGEFIMVVTLFWRSFKIQIGHTGFFDHNKHQWAKFYFQLIR